MKNFCKIVRFVALLLLGSGVFHSCLFENDMSYPYIKGEFVAFEVDGQTDVSIDRTKRTVSVVINESADIRNLTVTRAEINPEAHFVEALPSVLDLSMPYSVTLHTYEDYVWTISAEQPVERYVRCEGQSGDAVFDEKEHRVHVYVTEHTDLSAVVFNEMKLSREGWKVIRTTKHDGTDEVSVDEFPLTLNCIYARKLYVVSDDGAGDMEEVWTMLVEHKAIEPEIISVMPWVYSADVDAVFAGVGTPVIEYRQVAAEPEIPADPENPEQPSEPEPPVFRTEDGAEPEPPVENEWIPLTDIEVSGTDVTAKIAGLAENTSYEVRISVGETVSEPVQFTTGLPEQIYNMNFDEWQQNGKVWYPRLSEEFKVWDTANGGAANFIGSTTTPVSDFVAVSGDKKQAARLESKLAVIAFAAGNIYTGEFIKINGLGAELKWGTPFSGRPKALKGYYSYSPQIINRVKPPYESLKGSSDQCQILVILTDWDEPFLVNTTEGTFVDQDNDPHIIAYTKFESPEKTDGYKEFELELEYRRPDAVPKYAVVVACASYKGDFFTGGEGSVMHVDEFEFVYE